MCDSYIYIDRQIFIQLDLPPDLFIIFPFFIRHKYLHFIRVRTHPVSFSHQFNESGNLLGVLENWPCRKWLIVRRIRVNYKHLRYVIVSSVCCDISCRVHVKGLDHAFLKFILLILPVTIHYALWNFTLTKNYLV